MNIPDPSWKLYPDIVAEESYRERYLMDDEDEEEIEDEEE